MNGSHAKCKSLQIARGCTKYFFDVVSNCMKELNSELERIKQLIARDGRDVVAKRAKVSKRTLSYILSGKFKPSYTTMQKLLADAVKNL